MWLKGGTFETFPREFGATNDVIPGLFLVVCLIIRIARFDLFRALRAAECRDIYPRGIARASPRVPNYDANS